MSRKFSDCEFVIVCLSVFVCVCVCVYNFLCIVCYILIQLMIKIQYFWWLLQNSFTRSVHIFLLLIESFGFRWNIGTCPMTSFSLLQQFIIKNNLFLTKSPTHTPLLRENCHIPTISLKSFVLKTYFISCDPLTRHSRFYNQMFGFYFSQNSFQLTPF